MARNANTLFASLLLVAAAAVGWYALREAPATGDPLNTEPAPPATSRPQDIGVAPVDERREVPTPIVERRSQRGAVIGDDRPQGFLGLVVDNMGAPVQNTRLTLVHGFQIGNLADFLRQMHKKGGLLKVESQALSDQLGRFRLPCNEYSPQQPFEIRVEHDNLVCQDKKMDLRVALGEYRDVGRITLKLGNVVKGRITTEGGAAIAGARVRLRGQSNSAFLRMPGREQGIEIEVAQTGLFEFKNVEPGTVELDAAARGYAMVVKSNVLVSDGQQTPDVEFQLPRGYEIAGVVIDASGQPIPGATVTADAISAKNPLSVTRVADKTGTFELVGLLEGQYTLSAEAESFCKGEKKPVQAGERNAQIVCEKQGAVRVFVTGHNGQALRRFVLEVKRFFPGQPENFGHVPEKQYPIEVRNAKNGMCLVEGLNPEHYVVQVEAPDYAKKYSEPFQVTLGSEIPEVRVQLSQGGGIVGQIVGADGKGIPGVAVTTRNNNLMDNPFIDAIDFLVPKKITVTQVTTDANGRFRLALLRPDNYQLRMTHEAYVGIARNDVVVPEGQVTDLGTIVLAAGIQVRGLVYCNGLPSAAVEVSVSPETGSAGPSGTAVTDAQGRFAIATRLPPGQYQATARRTSHPNPIIGLADLQRSKKSIQLVNGATVADIQLEINEAR